MATSLVTEFQSLTGDSLESELGEVGDEPGMDQMFEETSQEQDFVGLGVDFDFCNDLQLDGVDFPMDIWNSAPTDENLELNQKLEENFNIDEDFNQMLNEWDNQLDSLQSSPGMDEILQTNSRSEETTLEPETLQVQQTVTLKKPNQTNTYRGMITSNQTRQVPLSSALRSPLVTRGVCYTRAGGLGVSRSVQSAGFVNTSPRVTFSSQFSTTSPRPSTEEAPLIYTPVSPIRSPSSSNAPDFFIASTRSTADVVKSNYSRFISQSRSSIITTNPDSANRYGSDHRNSQVKIIASVSPKSDGTSTAKILSSSSIRESLPKELIDKIRAASQGRKTIAIIEPINRRDSSASSDQSQFRSKQTSRFGSAAATLGKWRNVGIIPPFSNNVSDHDYCSPSRASRFSRKYLNAQSKVMRQIEESMCRNKPGRVDSPGEEGETKKDSGLESCEMSDASEDGTLYDKLPRYLTNASVQTIESRSVQDDHGYNRLPAYMIKPQQSLLKSNLTRSVAEKHNIVISAIECFDQKPDNYDVKPDISLADHCPPPPAVADNLVRVEMQGNNSELSKRDGLNSSRVPGEENPVNTSSIDKSHLKRRRESVDSSSDSDGSYRRSFKRRRSNYPRDMKVRPSSRERRRRFRGRSRSFSSSPDRSTSRSGWSSRPSSREHERSRRHGGERRERRGHPAEHRSQPSDHKAYAEDRKVIYVGGIEEGTLKSDLRARFEAFGPVVDISVHFRDRGDNYGFLTFQHQADAYAAIEHGNDDKSLPRYDLCFGGRRTFCKEDYYDLDDVEFDGAGGGAQGFDELLRRARKEIRK